MHFLRALCEELSAALASAGLDREPLAWIGFDACLMSSVEVAAAVAPYAGYMISSQAEEPHTGWNYSFLKGLAEDTDAPETGRRIIDAYFSGQEESARDLTLACIDLSAVGRVVTAMDVFYADLASRLTPESFADIADKVQKDLAAGKSITTFRDFYNVWYSVTEKAYESLLMTDAFAKSFCGFADRYAKFMVAQNKVLERMLSSLPIPTNTDMKSLYKTVYDLRKEVRDLKKALAAMEEKKGVE